LRSFSSENTLFLRLFPFLGSRLTIDINLKLTERQSGNIKTARSHVRANQELDLLSLKHLQVLFTLLWFPVAVQADARVALSSTLAEISLQVVTVLFGTTEDYGPIHIVLLYSVDTMYIAFCFSQKLFAYATLLADPHC